MDIEFTWHHVSFQYSHHPHHSPHSSDHWAGDVPHFLLVVKYLDKNKTCYILIGKHIIRNTLVMFSGFLLFYIKKMYDLQELGNFASSCVGVPGLLLSGSGCYFFKNILITCYRNFKSTGNLG